MLCGGFLVLSAAILENDVDKSASTRTKTVVLAKQASQRRSISRPRSERGASVVLGYVSLPRPHTTVRRSVRRMQPPKAGRTFLRKESVLVELERLTFAR